MDNDSLRRQLQDMEDASERWRSERRRLNSEIDKLEGALADAKSGARKRTALPDEKSSGADPAAAAKAQEAADQKFKLASQQWESERAKLQSQINRLEGAVAEAIARAANPMRATQSVKEQYETEINRIAKEKTELEQTYLRGKSEWEQEKLKMTGEMVKLRRTAQIMGRPVLKEDAPEANPRIRDLEEQLKDNLAKSSAEREHFVAQIQKLDEAALQWNAERRQLNDHAGQLQEAFMQAQAKVQSYEAAARTPNTPDPSGAKLEDLKKENESLQRQLKDAQNAWDEERRRLEQQLQRMSETRDHVSSEIVDQLRRQYDQRLQEAITQKSQLSQDLQNASVMLEAERARLSAAQSAGNDSDGLDTEAIQAEVSRVEGLISQIIAIIDDPDTDLSTVIRKNVEKAEFDAYLKGILFSLGRGK
jgi:chromosome segregation ATPase